MHTSLCIKGYNDFIMYTIITYLLILVFFLRQLYNISLKYEGGQRYGERKPESAQWKPTNFRRLLEDLRRKGTNIQSFLVQLYCTWQIAINFDKQLVQQNIYDFAM